MKKGLVLAFSLASLGLAGCAAYDPYYDSYYAPSASVVVAPSFYGGTYAYGPRYRYYDNRYYYYRDYR